MWVRNCWQVAAFSREVSAAILARRFLNDPVILYRTAAGSVVSLEDRCPHRLVPLSLATRKGDGIVCGYHGIELGPDGVCTAVPGQTTVPPGAKARSYPVIERYNLVWIWMGSPELADPALVPDVHWMDDPGWVPSEGYHHFDADYRLVTDNLLDLSHETYVHLETIGNDAVADSPVHVSVEQDRIVRAHREMPNIDPPPFFAKNLQSDGKINRWQIAIYMPPGIHMTESAVHPVDTGRESAFIGRVLHLLTPETEHSTHYFWSLNRNYRRDDAGLTQFIREAVSDTFHQDRVVLELQDKSIRESGGVAIPRIALAVDAAPVRGRRLLAAMVEGERRDASAVVPPIPLVIEGANIPQARLHLGKQYE
jgi:vanillate O-demethylase monooxygenase subunit